MAEWAFFKAEKLGRKVSGSLKEYLGVMLLGMLVARANFLGVYPFAFALLAVLALQKRKMFFQGIAGVFLGLFSINNLDLFWELIPSIVLYGYFMPKVKDKKAEILILPVLTAIFISLSGVIFLGLLNELTEEKVILLMTKSILAAGFSIVFLYAFQNSDRIFKGNLSGDQGVAWILVLAVCLSGLQGLEVGAINLQIVVLGFFILYIADRFGAGSASGAGAILGFLLNSNYSIDSLVDAGIYGLLGFFCGGFSRFGKIGLAVSYTSSVLLMTFFVNDNFLTSHLYSSALGLLFYILLPGKRKEKSFKKKNVMPEIETTVSKVKAMAEIFDQLAYGFQAAGVESGIKPEVPELMDILVERICKDCPTAGICWEREFYRTYNFLFDLLARQEQELEAANPDMENFPAEWKKCCNRLKEMRVASRFILEQQKDKEAWQKRLALSRDALADQYRNVSQVIGHLARELHSRHNTEAGKPLVWSRQHKLVLELGAGIFIKTGNSVSGDNFCAVPLAENISALIVCDGMGVGEDAAKMSSAALKILEQLLETGFEPEGAIKALNSILVLRSPEESFVTVDMAVLNLEAGSARLIKIGAAPTYVLAKNKVEIVKTSSLPVGILNDIDIPVIDVPFKENTLIIVTDGILDVDKKKDWLKSFLENLPRLPAQELADSIIKEARKLAGENLADDGVVLVVRKK